MTRRGVVLLLVLALGACGADDKAAPYASSATSRAPSAITAPDPVAKGLPHGGLIKQVAVTEQADAAITFDGLGGVRLWPALDGSRTPVPVSLVAPRRLALAHAGRDLLAAALDEAGSIDLVRLGRDGSVRARVQVPASVAYEQMFALGDGVLVRGEDHAIEWFGPDGASRGKLVVEPGQRVQAIAVRRDRAVAIVGANATHELRWLHTIGNTLTWGPRMTLPDAVKGELVAVSPSHRRLALVDASAKLAVFDLGLAPVRIAGPTLFAHDARDIGFIDEDHVAIMGTSVQWWSLPQPRDPGDPWAVTTSNMPVPSNQQASDGGAVGDGLAVTGFGAALALTDHDRVRYLGYKDHGVDTIGIVGRSLWMTLSGSHVLWLDEKLAIAREIELRKEPNGPWVHATAIGDHHVVTQSASGGTYSVQLVDVERPEQPVSLGTYPSVERIEYAPESGVVAIRLYGRVERFALDLATNTARKLAPLERTGSLASLRLLDPARAGGIAAIALGWTHDYDESYTLTMYRENGTQKRIRPFSATLIGIDPDGTMYTYTANEIQVRRGTEKLASFPAEGIQSPVAVSVGGARFAMRDRNDVVVLDGKGTVLWRKPVWGAAQLVFTPGGKHLAVRGVGGLALLAADTGERVALECGWSFGLMTTPPASHAVGVAPVCEDPLL